MIENLILADSILLHINDSMKLALSSERHPLWKRACQELANIDFIHLGLYRCISIIDTERHFLQITDDIHSEHVPLTTYFKSLASPRRMNILKAVEQQSYQLLSQQLQEQEIDYLQFYSELEEYSTCLAVEFSFKTEII